MRILIVEDDLVMADFLEEVLVDIGHEVCGIAGTVDAGVDQLRRDRPDVAILDMKLGLSGFGTDIANRLGDAQDLGRTGILYLTGQPDRVLREARFGHACLTKPYMPDTLELALTIVDEIAQSGASSLPLPRGMELLAAFKGAGAMPA